MLPKFEGAFTAELIESVRKRRKAIAYHARALRCDKVIERSKDAECEKMEIELPVTSSAGACTVRLFAWEDRWLFVDARVMGKRGWAWEWTREGKILGSVSGRTVVAALEQTMQIASSLMGSDTGAIDDLWVPMFAAKPRLVSR